MTEIEKLYNNPKSKNFVNHLILAYLPVYKVKKLFSFNDNNHKCSICKQSLFSIDEYFNGVSEKKDDIFNEMSDYLIKSVNGEKVKREDHPMIKHVIGNRVIAFTGNKTNTHLCLNCVKDLLEFTQNKLLVNDKNITWIINKMKREELFSNFYDSPNLSSNEKKEVTKIHKKIENSPKKKATFADLGVLQKLKEKMK